MLLNFTFKLKNTGRYCTLKCPVCEGGSKQWLQLLGYFGILCIFYFWSLRKDVLPDFTFIPCLLPSLSHQHFSSHFEYHLLQNIFLVFQTITFAWSMHWPQTLNFSFITLITIYLKIFLPSLLLCNGCDAEDYVLDFLHSQTQPTDK